MSEKIVIPEEHHKGVGARIAASQSALWAHIHLEHAHKHLEEAMGELNELSGILPTDEEWHEQAQYLLHMVGRDKERVYYVMSLTNTMAHAQRDIMERAMREEEE